jgi:hypothetical protein
MKIRISDIENITLLLLSKLRAEVGEDVVVSKDFYWDIPQEEIYNPYEEPKNLTLGQLSDEYDEILRLKRTGDDAMAYDLKRLSAILRILYHENQISF